MFLGGVNKIGPGGWGSYKKNDWEVREKKMYGGGGVCEKNVCVCGGGASEIFSSPSPPEDFKWNSP